MLKKLFYVLVFACCLYQLNASVVYTPYTQVKSSCKCPADLCKCSDCHHNTPEDLDCEINAVGCSTENTIVSKNTNTKFLVPLTQKNHPLLHINPSDSLLVHNGFKVSYILKRPPQLHS